MVYRSVQPNVTNPKGSMSFAVCKVCPLDSWPGYGEGKGRKPLEEPQKGDVVLYKVHVTFILKMEIQLYQEQWELWPHAACTIWAHKHLEERRDITES